MRRQQRRVILLDRRCLAEIVTRHLLVVMPQRRCHPVGREGRTARRRTNASGHVNNRNRLIVRRRDRATRLRGGSAAHVGVVMRHHRMYPTIAYRLRRRQCARWRRLRSCHHRHHRRCRRFAGVRTRVSGRRHRQLDARHRRRISQRHPVHHRRRRVVAVWRASCRHRQLQVHRRTIRSQRRPRQPRRHPVVYRRCVCASGVRRRRGHRRQPLLSLMVTRHSFPSHPDRHRPSGHHECARMVTLKASSSFKNNYVHLFVYNKNTVFARQCTFR